MKLPSYRNYFLKIPSSDNGKMILVEIKLYPLYYAFVFTTK